jgi:16S rRNA (cytidine1402-2'-O)-methyltransferase
MKGTLYLLPNVLSDARAYEYQLPKRVFDVVQVLDGVIAENEKEARKYLKQFSLKKPLQQMPIKILCEHTHPSELECLLEPMASGEDWGLLSDAGLPCIADPGSPLVLLAQKKTIPVEALVGPSSLFLALMLSGLSGQKFTFCGYLPKKREERTLEIQKLEARAKKEGMTHLCIEAPYRNKELLEDLLFTLSPSTRLCVACHILAPDQEVITLTVSEWKKRPLPEINKKPAIFLFS